MMECAAGERGEISAVAPWLLREEGKHIPERGPESEPAPSPAGWKREKEIQGGHTAESLRIHLVT